MQIDYATIIVWVTGGAVFLLVGSIWLMATIGVQMRRASGEEKLARRLDNVRRGRNEKTRTLRLWHDGKVGTTVVSGPPRTLDDSRASARCGDARVTATSRIIAKSGRRCGITILCVLRSSGYSVERPRRDGAATLILAV